MSGGKLIEARTAASPGAFIFLLASPFLAIFALRVTVFPTLHHTGEIVALLQPADQGLVAPWRQKKPSLHCAGLA